MNEPPGDDRSRLLGLFTRLSFERRPVTLASGKKSDFYLDLKRALLTAEGHFLVGKLALDAIVRFFPEARAAGGMTLGADPIASAVSLSSYLEGRPLAAFIVRKEPKGHGTGQWIEGRKNLEDACPVVILEDVVTTGQSTLKAIDRATAEGLKVVGVVALVDRQEGGREAIEARNVRLVSLFGRKDFPP